VSTAAAQTHGARLAERYGEAVDDQSGGLTRLFPDMAMLAKTDVAALAMPTSRRQSVLALARAVTSGMLDLGAGADWEVARSALAILPGVGPWTVEIVAMRGLGDPDAFTPTDLGVRQAAASAGLPTSPAALIRRAERWRPWRAYAVQYLWATSDHAINRLPAA